MSLNIKNPETNRLAEELAALTNENKTQAITIALQERLERETRRRAREECRAKTSYTRNRGQFEAASAPRPIRQGDSGLPLWRVR